MSSNPASADEAAKLIQTRVRESRANVSKKDGGASADASFYLEEKAKTHPMSLNCDPTAKGLKGRVDSLHKVDLWKTHGKSFLAAVRTGRLDDKVLSEVQGVYDTVAKACGGVLKSSDLRCHTFEGMLYNHGLLLDDGVQKLLLVEGAADARPKSEEKGTVCLSYDFIGFGRRGGYPDSSDSQPVKRESGVSGGGSLGDEETKPGDVDVSPSSLTSPPPARSEDPYVHPPIGTQWLNARALNYVITDNKKWAEKIKEQGDHSWRALAPNALILERQRDLWNEAQVVLFKFAQKAAIELKRDLGKLGNAKGQVAQLVQSMDVISKEEKHQNASGFTKRTPMDELLGIYYSGTEHLSVIVALLDSFRATDILHRCQQLLDLSRHDLTGKGPLEIVSKVKEILVEYDAQFGGGTQSSPIDTVILGPLLILAAFEQYLSDHQLGVYYPEFENVVDQARGVYLQGVQEERRGSTTFEQARQAPIACMDTLVYWATTRWTRDLPPTAIEAQKRMASQTKSKKTKTKSALAGAADGGTSREGGRGRGRGSSRGRGRGSGGRGDSASQPPPHRVQQRNLIPRPRAVVPELLSPDHPISVKGHKRLLDLSQPDSNNIRHPFICWRNLSDQARQWAAGKEVKLHPRLMENVRMETTRNGYNYVTLDPNHDLTLSDFEQFDPPSYIYLLMLLGKVDRGYVKKVEDRTKSSFYLYSSESDGGDGGSQGHVAASSVRSHSQPPPESSNLKHIKLEGHAASGTANKQQPPVPPAPAPTPQPQAPTGYPYGQFPQQFPQYPMPPMAAPYPPPPASMFGPGLGFPNPPNIVPPPPPYSTSAYGDSGGRRGGYYGDGMEVSPPAPEDEAAHLRSQLQQQHHHNQMLQQQQQHTAALQHIDNKVNQIVDSTNAQIGQTRAEVAELVGATNNIIDVVKGEPGSSNTPPHTTPPTEEVTQGVNPM